MAFNVLHFVVALSSICCILATTYEACEGNFDCPSSGVCCNNICMLGPDCTGSYCTDNTNHGSCLPSESCCNNECVNASSCLGRGCTNDNNCRGAKEVCCNKKCIDIKAICPLNTIHIVIITLVAVGAAAIIAIFVIRGHRRRLRRRRQQGIGNPQEPYQHLENEQPQNDNERTIGQQTLPSIPHNNELVSI